MTPDRLKECVAVLGWSLRGLADMLSCDDRLVRRWGSGAASIPPAVAEWLEALTAAHLAHPPPQEWRRRVAA